MWLTCRSWYARHLKIARAYEIYTNTPQVELKLKYKFRLILDETWSYGVLGRTGGGVTEAQNVDAKEIDMVIGSLSGPLCAAGGFCAGNEEVVEHQRISSASYTYSAALPALLSTTASETISLLQEQPELVTALRDNVKAMRAQLDPRSDWVNTQSAPDNPMILLTLKPEVVEAKKLSIDDQNQILRDVVDEVRSHLPHPLFYTCANVS
jgi:serine palmitoyltransferase